MSKIEVDAIDKQSGSTLTLGGSGTAVTLASGATQTGFGRTGTVDWDTTPKTATFSAVSGNGYFVNTSGGAVTVNLPASPSGGDIVALSDYAGTALTNNITIARNGSNINGSTQDITISKNNSAIFLVYVDATQGWKNTETSNLNDIEEQPAFIVATGGTITCCGNFKIHTFTGPGTFTVCSVGNPLGSQSVDYIVVAGGGGGGGEDSGGGGGAGGYRESCGGASGCYATSPLANPCGALPVCAQAYPITVGSGGTSGNTGGSPNGGNGSNSVFSTITSTGGGGAGEGGGPADNGQPGGSGGGAGGGSLTPRTGGSGNTPPVSPPQGNPGGNNTTTSAYGGGGGGGSSAAGANGVTGCGGNGGNGLANSITGSSVTRAGGGGGGTGASSGGGTGGTGGGGDAGNSGPGSCGQSGTANTGGGGGGSKAVPTATGGAGGSGIVIIRYKFQ